MNRVAIAFSTKDRVELSKQSIEPLLQPDKFDLFWSDGSDTKQGHDFPLSADYAERGARKIEWNVRGGADAAIVFNLTKMLEKMITTPHEKFGGFTIAPQYDYVGLVENDVLLASDWFESTMDLFRFGRSDGLDVGAVSARSYEDRILIQRDNYAVMANLGAGMVIFSRRAAELVLQYFRTGFTTELRRTWMQTAGLDFARWSGFVMSPHMCCADWNFERVLAEHGMASLALTPAKCSMIGQEPPLAEQGLVLTPGPAEMLRNDGAFNHLRNQLSSIRDGALKMPDGRFMPCGGGNVTVFPHQIGMLGGHYAGDWSLKWQMGFGPFGWKSSNAEHDGGYLNNKVSVPVTGPCQLLVAGGDKGGKISVRDEQSGYEFSTDIVPEGPEGQIMPLVVPGNNCRTVTLTLHSPGLVFYGLVCDAQQVVDPTFRFDHSVLPSP